jgi:hypothetical protein
MTPLRMKMIEDMRLAGLAPSTQAIYLQAVRALAAHYKRSPDLLCEAEVRSYLLHLRERGVALGTFKPHHGGAPTVRPSTEHSIASLAASPHYRVQSNEVSAAASATETLNSLCFRCGVRCQGHGA